PGRVQHDGGGAHVTASLAGRRAGGAQDSRALASGGPGSGGWPGASGVWAPGSRSAKRCGVRPGGCGGTLPRLTEGVSEAVPAVLQEGPLRPVGGGGDGRIVSGPGLVPLAEPTQQVRAGGVEQV